MISLGHTDVVRNVSLIKPITKARKSISKTKSKDEQEFGCPYQNIDSKNIIEQENKKNVLHTKKKINLVKISINNNNVTEVKETVNSFLTEKKIIDRDTGDCEIHPKLTIESNNKLNSIPVQQQDHEIVPDNNKNRKGIINSLRSIFKFKF